MTTTEKDFSGTVLMVYDERSYLESLIVSKDRAGYELVSKTSEIYNRLEQIASLKSLGFVKIRSRNETFYLNANLIANVESAKDNLGNKSCKISLKVPGLDVLAVPIEHFDNLKRFVRSK